MDLHLIGTFLILVGLELVLGIDNILLVSVISDRCAPQHRDRTRKLGIVLAAALHRAHPAEAQIEKKIAFEKKEGSLQDKLRQRGITLEDYKKELYAQQAFVNIVTKGIKVDDKEVKEFYAKAKDSLYTKPERTLISAVICNSKQQIDKAYSQLKNAQT